MYLYRLVVSLSGDCCAAHFIREPLDKRSAIETHDLRRGAQPPLHQRVHCTIVRRDLVNTFELFDLRERFSFDGYVVSRDVLPDRHRTDLEFALVLVEEAYNSFR